MPLLLRRVSVGCVDFTSGLSIGFPSTRPLLEQKVVLGVHRSAILPILHDNKIDIWKTTLLIFSNVFHEHISLLVTRIHKFP